MEEIRELLKKLETQVDGVESYLQRLNDIGHSDEFFVVGNACCFGTTLRVQSDIANEIHVQGIRKALDTIERELKRNYLEETKKE